MNHITPAEPALDLDSAITAIDLLARQQRSREEDAALEYRRAQAQADQHAEQMRLHANKAAGFELALSLLRARQG